MATIELFFFLIRTLWPQEVKHDIKMTDNITLQSWNDAERHTRVRSLRHGYTINAKQIPQNDKQGHVLTTMFHNTLSCGLNLHNLWP